MWVLNHLGDHNNVDNPFLDESPPPHHWHPHGGAGALQGAMSELEIGDSFRYLNGSLGEFTRFPEGSLASIGTRRRLDRILCSNSMLQAHGLPRVRKVWHIHPTDPLLSHSDGVRRPSDHAAVALDVALSAQPKPPATWSLGYHHLLDEHTRETLRDIITWELCELPRRYPAGSQDCATRY